MYNYCYVNKNETAPLKNEIIALLNEVQDEVSECFSFDFKLVESASLNMITCESNGNTGFDFDYNIEPNDPDEEFEPEEIHNIIFDAIRRHTQKPNYINIFEPYPRRYFKQFNDIRVEESTSVITLKAVDTYHKKILFSCDFAIVYNCRNGQQQYIRFNKKQQTFTWEYRGKGFYIEPKIKWLKKNNYWNDVRDYYLYKKNTNDNPDKHSRSLLAEAVNERYHKYHG